MTLSMLRRHRRVSGRLALLTAVLVLARLVAWEVHAVTADHGPLHDCVVCAQVDRAHDGPLPSVGQVLAVPDRDPLPGAPRGSLASRPAPAPAARGPPASPTA